jgi:hypothetical protein
VLAFRGRRPNDAEGFGHVKNILLRENIFAEILGYSFNVAAQLEQRDMSWSENKFLIHLQS